MNKFQLPAEFSKTILNPKKYIALLNTLAVEGFDTPGKLRVSAKRVIKKIDELVEGDSLAARHKKRYYVSAILWVQKPSYRAIKNHYYTYYQTILPLKNNINDQEWKPRSSYVAPEKSDTE